MSTWDFEKRSYLPLPSASAKHVDGKGHHHEPSDASNALSKRDGSDSISHPSTKPISIASPSQNASPISQTPISQIPSSNSDSTNDRDMIPNFSSKYYPHPKAKSKTNQGHPFTSSTSTQESESKPKSKTESITNSITFPNSNSNPNPNPNPNPTANSNTNTNMDANTNTNTNTNTHPSNKQKNHTNPNSSSGIETLPLRPLPRNTNRPFDATLPPPPQPPSFQQPYAPQPYSNIHPNRPYSSPYSSSYNSTYGSPYTAPYSPVGPSQISTASHRQNPWPSSSSSSSSSNTREEKSFANTQQMPLPRDEKAQHNPYSHINVRENPDGYVSHQDGSAEKRPSASITSSLKIPDAKRPPYTRPASTHSPATKAPLSVLPLSSSVPPSQTSLQNGPAHSQSKAQMALNRSKHQKIGKLQVKPDVSWRSLPSDQDAASVAGGGSQPPRDRKMDRTVPSSDDAGNLNKELDPRDALAYLEKIKICFHDQPWVYTSFLDSMKELKSQSIDTIGIIQRIKELFNGHRDLIIGFNRFLPQGFFIDVEDTNVSVSREISPPENDHTAPQGNGVEYELATNLLKAIKTRFIHQPSVYATFIDILQSFQADNAILQDVYDKVASLFVDHQDLLQRFQRLFPRFDDQGETPKAGHVLSAEDDRSYLRSTTNDSLSLVSLDKHSKQKDINATDDQHTNANKQDGRQEGTTTSLSDSKQGLKRIIQSFKSIIQDPRLYIDALALIEQHRIGTMAQSTITQALISMFLAYPEVCQALESYSVTAPNDSVSKTNSSSPDNEHSYLPIPDHELLPLCSGRTELCDKILNDIYVSQPTGSEEGFSYVRKSQYDEALFKCEDEKHDFDIMINVNSSTITLLEQVIDDCQNLSDHELMSYNVCNVLFPTHLRNIERIYGARGSEVVDGLKLNPLVAGPIILRRLKQKDEEWRSYSRERSKAFRQVFELNFQKSLEYRVNILKSTDRRLMNPRSMIQEAYRLKESLGERKEHFYFRIRDRDVICDIINVLKSHVEDAGYSTSKWNILVAEVLLPLFNISPEGPTKQKEQFPRHAFLGNSSFYIFFRLLQILYERLSRTKNMHYSLDAKKESAMYKSLLRMLSKLKDDHLESGRFEDDVRMLYGYQGVFLATLDRLFIFLKKELLLLLRCETCERLISLYTWERNHRNPEETTYYLLNTSILLNEGPCFRFEFVQEGALIIHLLERDVQIALMEKLLRRWRTYVGLYFERQPGVDSKTTHAPFLKRNLRNAKAELSLGHKAFIQNNLQCRIAVNNLKIIFVTGTEDFMYRPLQARRQSASNPRKSPSVEQCNHRLEKMHRILALSDCSPEISHAVVPDIVDETMHDSSSVVVSSDPPCDDPLEMLGVD